MHLKRDKMIKKVHKNTNITKSQKEMRLAFLGGFAGQLVSGLILKEDTNR